MHMHMHMHMHMCMCMYLTREKNAQENWARIFSESARAVRGGIDNTSRKGKYSTIVCLSVCLSVSTQGPNRSECNAKTLKRTCAQYTPYS